MPNIRVTCPACNTTLELDAQYAGQEVECGSCLQVFAATPPAPARPPAIRGVPPTKPAPRRGPPPRRPAPRDDDDYPHDHYDDDYPETRAANGLGTASLVLGILSIVAFCCWPV